MGKTLVYSTGFKVHDVNGVSVFLNVGRYLFEKDGLGRLDYFLFTPGANPPAWNTPVTHAPMHAPYGGNCTPGPFQIPAYQDYQTYPMSWKVSGNELVVRIGEARHTWKRDLAHAGAYVMSTPFLDDKTGNPVLLGQTYSDTVGFGYLVDGTDGPPLKPEEFSSGYDGEIYQIDANGTAATPWKHSETGLTMKLFEFTGNLGTLSQPAPVPWNSKMWWQNDILLNYAPWSPYIVYSNGGHDFNMDGCLDEPGHMLEMLAAHGKDGAEGLVFIEQTWETHGFPIVSVGRYFR